jgi:hypothetical protein
MNVGPQRRYRCLWGDGYEKATDDQPKVEARGLLSFTEATGYDEETIEKIEALPIGGALDLSGPSGTHHLLRLPDLDASVALDDSTPERLIETLNLKYPGIQADLMEADEVGVDRHDNPKVPEKLVCLVWEDMCIVDPTSCSSNGGMFPVNSAAEYGILDADARLIQRYNQVGLATIPEPPVPAVPPPVAKADAPHPRTPRP